MLSNRSGKRGSRASVPESAPETPFSRSTVAREGFLGYRTPLEVAETWQVFSQGATRRSFDIAASEVRPSPPATEPLGADLRREALEAAGLPD